MRAFFLFIDVTDEGRTFVQHLGDAVVVSLAGSAGVAAPGETQALDWGLAMGISMGNFAASKIAATGEAHAQARQFTRRHLMRWGLEEVVDDVITVVGELTGNAVRHTAAAADGAWLALATSPRTVLCIVRDPSPQVPAPRTADQLASCGRGLGVVASLSSMWGWRVEGDGKAVWARIPI
jgi:anti-sigma regulatory factor (Ser/Thr protein kinase)